MFKFFLFRAIGNWHKTGTTFLQFFGKRSEDSIKQSKNINSFPVCVLQCQCTSCGNKIKKSFMHFLFIDISSEARAHSHRRVLRENRINDTHQRSTGDRRV